MQKENSEEVRLSFHGRIARLTLQNAGKRNAMTLAMGDAFAAHVRAINARNDIGAVIVSGEGGVFSGGGDLSMLDALRGQSRAECIAAMHRFYGGYLSVLDLTVPSIAAIEGAAVGAGLCLAFACDLRLVASDAKLAFNFMRLGLHPGMGGTFLAPHRLGPERAADLLYTGRRFTGSEAVAMGAALRHMPASEVQAQADALAAELALGAPLAVRAMKRNLSFDRDAFAGALQREAEAQAESYASWDLGEGIKATLERRLPAFRGA
jgi:enoyl-CoA hydratase/carnithine racemase